MRAASATISTEAAGFGWTRSGADIRLADARRRQGKGNHAPLRALSRQSRKIRRRHHREPRRNPRRPTRCASRPTGGACARATFSSRRAARPVLEPPIPGREYAITSNEIFDLPSLPGRLLDHRRRLYRGRIRLDFRAARNQGHDRDARRERAARLRRGHALRRARRADPCRRRAPFQPHARCASKRPRRACLRMAPRASISMSIRS